MKFLSVILLFISIIGHGQSEVQDSMTFESSYAWLERKMTFNYYDPTNDHWWVNRIQPNEDGTYTIKNIAAKHPDKILEKVYHNRTLFLFDLNPNSVSIIDLPKDQGRFVKGKIVRVEGFSDEKSIQVIKDGRRGSKVNFLHISVPEVLLDSAQLYANELKERMQQVIYLNARLFNIGNLEDNITAAFKAFRGKYVNEDSTAYLDFEVMDIGLVRFTLRRDNRVYFGTIGFDVDRKAVYFFMAGNKAYDLRDMVFEEDTDDLILGSGDDRIHLIGRNTIDFKLKFLNGLFYRY